MLIKRLQVVLALSLLVATGLFVAWSWHWPLLGDAALIHYIAFLIERGMAPYRVLGDMNMPGSYLLELAAMKLYGGGDVGWRLFDFTLMGAAAVAMGVMTRRAGWFAGVFAATLFALIHGRDGIIDAGQRDLSMAVLLLGATAFLFVALRVKDRRPSLWAWFGFGLLSGMAWTIKPTALPLTCAQAALAWWVLRPGNRKGLLMALAGMPLGPLGALIFLMREHAVMAFLHGLTTVVAYYASLAHKPTGFLLVHSVSPLLPLVAVWAVLLTLRRRRWGWERGLLGCGALFGLISYLVQARGLPYYRYPLLGFLLPLTAVDFSDALTGVGENLQAKTCGCLAALGLCFGGLFLGPHSAWMIHQYRWWEMDFISSLTTRLESLGGPQLSGQVQCVDSISGCGTTLYRMRLMPTSGVLSDFLLFGPPQLPVVEETRRTFRQAMDADPPRVIVVSSWLHMEGPDHFEKLERWPWLEGFLAGQYRLITEWSPTRTNRWWSREEVPASYRVYERINFVDSRRRTATE